MRIVAHVTQAHIDAGVVGGCSDCPVALAFAEAIGIDPKNGVIDVDRNAVCLENRTLRIAAKTPRNVADFIRAFDARQPVQPFVAVFGVQKWAVEKYKIQPRTESL